MSNTQFKYDEWIDVNSQSGNISQIKYAPVEGTLSVRFTGKGNTLSEYEHYNVPKELADQFLATAPNFNNSTGSFYRKNFHKGYGYRKVK